MAANHVTRRRALAVLAAVPATMALGTVLPTGSVQAAPERAPTVVQRLPVQDGADAFIRDRAPDAEALVFCPYCERVWRWAGRPTVDDDCSGRESWAPVTGQMRMRRTTSLHVLYDLASVAVWAIRDQGAIVFEGLRAMSDAETDEERQAARATFNEELTVLRDILDRKYGPRAGNLVWKHGIDLVERALLKLPDDEAA